MSQIDIFNRYKDSILRNSTLDNRFMLFFNTTCDIISSNGNINSFMFDSLLTIISYLYLNRNIIGNLDQNHHMRLIYNIPSGDILFSIQDKMADDYPTLYDRVYILRFGSLINDNNISYHYEKLYGRDELMSFKNRYTKIIDKLSIINKYSIVFQIIELDLNILSNLLNEDVENTSYLSYQKDYIKLKNLFECFNSEDTERFSELLTS